MKYSRFASTEPFIHYFRADNAAATAQMRRHSLMTPADSFEPSFITPHTQRAVMLHCCASIATRQAPLPPATQLPTQLYALYYARRRRDEYR